MDLILFLLSFVVILTGCEFFTNGVEWIGKRFNLSEGAVGSVLAAVGTALPETIVPLIAILLIGGSAGEEIGVGAILGAPFMLATLALFVCGMSVFMFAKRRGTKTLHINGKLIRRDLKFFLLAYGLAAVAALLPPEFNLFKVVLGFVLIPLYIVYTIYTLKTGEASCGEGEELKGLYIHGVIRKCTGKSGEPVECPVANDGSVEVGRRKQHEPSTVLIILQVLASLGLIIIGANLFVEQINGIAEILSINPADPGAHHSPDRHRAAGKVQQPAVDQGEKGYLRDRKHHRRHGVPELYSSHDRHCTHRLASRSHHRRRVPAGSRNRHSPAVRPYPVQGVQS